MYRNRVMIPDCTLVTSCFYLGEFNEDCRDKETSIRSLRPLLSVPCYLVIYTDAVLIESIRSIRDGYDSITKYVVMSVTELPNYDLVEVIKKNRQVYHPTADKRTCAESHFICCSKFQLVIKTMRDDPFGTSKFGWIDAHLGDNFSKVCLGYKDNMLLRVLEECREDKFHLQVLNVTDKKFVEDEHLHEYYQQYRWVVCGCLILTGKEVGGGILQDLVDNFVHTTRMGYGHGEEMLYLKILEDERYKSVLCKSYGDYQHILNNFICTSVGLDYILNMIVKRYLGFRYYPECVECCLKVVKDMESYENSMDVYHYLQFLFNGYIAAFYVNRPLAVELCRKIRELRKLPWFELEYSKQEGFYDSQLEFVQ